MISLFPRLLRVDDEAQARREILSIGADPAAAQNLAARMVRRMVRLSGVSCDALQALREEFSPLGGEVIAADGQEVLLAGSPQALRQLGRRLAGGNPDLAGMGNGILRLFDFGGGSPQRLLGRTCSLKLDRPLIMGILNVTPDSFSDGGRYRSLDDALRRALEMAEEGADLIDVGGESTRPGAETVPLEQEIERVVPVVAALRREIDLPLSVDTSKSAVAAAAMAAGAEFINDISGLQFDPEMARTVSAGGAGMFLMHTRGRPDRMQDDTCYQDLVGEVLLCLERSLRMAESAGIHRERLAVDPGIGFGKSAEGNLEILRRLNEFLCLGRPLLLGTSRKGFIGKILGQPDPRERLFGSNATVALGVERGAGIFRVHEVRAARETAMMAWAICRAEV